ncbi:hypothetical protein [Helicobacter mehlei]|uniref:hypothetical protein n=2 Tax=Helicobacter mehlei TaxID=2316080 RepID=UPI001F25306F|nr:hypothetical protein [Helicobacter mehlei]
MKFLLLLLPLLVQGAAMITLDTAANAKLAVSNANEGTMIAKMQEQLNHITHLLELAKNQVDTLKQAQQSLRETQEFMQASTLPQLEPMLVALQGDLERMQAHQNQLQALSQRYAQLEHAQMARWQQECPWLDFSNATIADSNHYQARKTQKLLENTHVVLSAPHLSALICQKLQQIEKQENHHAHLKRMQKALLAGDFKQFQTLSQARQANFEHDQITQEQDSQAKLAPLSKRLEQLHQELPSTRLSTQLSQLNTQLAQQLQSAQNERDQARAYAHYHQRAQSLQLELLLELTRHLSFLNETMSMGATLLAQIQKVSSPHLVSENSPSKLNAYGFPEVFP